MLIETILAAFEMDAILYELRDYGCALNAGRWDYIFSTIKKLGALLPDRSQVTMTVPFMRAYTELLVRTVPPARRARDRRHGGVHPVAARPGGERGRARAGCATTSSASPATGSTARGSPIPTWCRSRPRSSTACWATARTSSTGCATTSRSGPSSSSTSPSPAARSRPSGPARQRVRRARGTSTRGCTGPGAAAIDNLMEDVATAEIARSQVWSWVRAGEFAEADVRRELELVEAGAEAKELFAEVALGAELPEFLTLSAYPRLPG